MFNPTAIFLISCPDQKGIVARLSNFVFHHGGNIVDSDHHSDLQAGRFLGRIELELNGLDLDREGLRQGFAAIAAPMGGHWELYFSDEIPRIALWCSRQEHCLLDLIWRHQAGELGADIAFVMSNHDTLRRHVEPLGLPFHVVPITPETKSMAERKALALLRAERVDLVILAKYMQVLSPEFLAEFPAVINIHHSFLPAFAGAQPYHQAHARGVKLIGATAHYVTPDLDSGPIIEQDVVRVSHRDTTDDLVRKGKDMERLALSRAVRLHLQHRVLTYGNKTVVFE
ncbi:formyltetrahydrofolate deformylase [Geothrix sp. PMB-07]|uniref:formyltetrahydrofolate deformylase n=1 Tax=Geothrix sp. PMB-07 TaxID=3068640 RepID=UPI0027409952|nr:formyltetrahydrofolate deformylase [Geothrix sp. PMB-07]WLT31155.1 formyltetrahydrofolate deformylase [Geothrix sp. PMB-07]